jgi:hypothetical protein
MSLISTTQMNSLPRDSEESKSKEKKRSSSWTWRETYMTSEVTLLVQLMETVELQGRASKLKVLQMALSS